MNGGSAVRTDTGGRDEDLVGDRYRLRERLAAGGMGAVWAARDVLMEREVALKEMHVPAYLTDRRAHGESAGERGAAVERMRREARAAARVDHAAVVTIHDVILHDGHPWIVMELVRGETLADLLGREGPLSAVGAARLVLPVLEGLRAAHASGVLHRDVKPANILLGTDGRVVLTDFGIARIEGETSLTVTGEFFGSLRYCAPERMGGRRPGPASDLWSLGVVLYEAVEGASPFHRETMEATVAAVLSGAPRETPDGAGPLEPLLRGLLAQDPDERPDADEALESLRRVAEPTDVGERVRGPERESGVERERVREPEREPATEGERVPAQEPGPDSDPDPDPDPEPSGTEPPGPVRELPEYLDEGPGTADPDVPTQRVREREAPGADPDTTPEADPELDPGAHPEEGPAPRRHRLRPLLLGAAVCALLAAGSGSWFLLRDAGGGTGAGADGNGPPRARSSVSAAPEPAWKKRSRTYREGELGYRIAVPASFVRSAEGDRIVYRDPEDKQVWIEVYRDSGAGPGTPAAWARREVGTLTRGARDSSGRRTARTEPGVLAETRHAGRPAARYTVALQTMGADGGASKHIVQRNLVVPGAEGKGDGMYQLRVSVPQSEDAEVDGEALFDTAAADFG